ncbi:4-(cytidine 5'-diphospho)-2-C-methyl-D-erythritol kinase [Fusibacter bizertensis]|uniref:4-diphosphocytidyl-2-C-methyl-D-erythritol kinase n=1 Tax=Fusibacter bizertensis TaxID=1488331 RepID=A0ABT6NFL2_9FIRM|nr:4-(cytidine 5'-diphospho)-2-C-methyl-D-erythritol kinase [Fusibacter bizertensis]MDH8679222.1 4-(cytidine 5'-diphospho)-2-C-methyl-D-erythritol kinase [Fusibacter bizertensis]
MTTDTEVEHNTTIKLKARAKINLTLDVLSRRENGYHDVEMLMQQINLYDNVTVTKNSTGEINLTCSDPFLPVDEKNIAYQAVKIMKELYQLEEGFDLHIDKQIPVAAGLAGGSTDAAAVIMAINQLCKLDLPVERLQEIGFKLGADVPFCFLEGCALAKGLGEILKPIRGFEHAWMVLVKPSFGVSTKDVYGGLDLDAIKHRPETSKMIKALEEQNKHVILSGLCNVLETVTLNLYPKVSEIKEKLNSYGAEGVLMSGSGPSVFGFFSSYERAKKAHKKLKKQYPQSYVVSTYNL